MLLSARTIPGHERSVNRMCDHLVRRGARVVREADPPDPRVGSRAPRGDRGVVPDGPAARRDAGARRPAHARRGGRGRVRGRRRPERRPRRRQRRPADARARASRASSRERSPAARSLSRRAHRGGRARTSLRERRQLARGAAWSSSCVRGGDVDVVSRGVAAAKAELDRRGLPGRARRARARHARGAAPTRSGCAPRSPSPAGAPAAASSGSSRSSWSCSGEERATEPLC